MKSIDELKAKFFSDESISEKQLTTIVAKAVPFCRTDKTGAVLIEATKVDGKAKVMLTLIARAVANMLDKGIDASVSIAEISTATRLPAPQVRVYAGRLAKDKLIETVKAGVFRARAHKIEGYLDNLTANP